MSNDADVRVRVSGENGKTLNSNTNGVRIEMEEGKLYILSIEYKNGFCEYEVYIELPWINCNSGISIGGPIDSIRIWRSL